MPLGVVMDERIASGHDMAQAFSQIKKYLAEDPSLMVKCVKTLDAENKRRSRARKRRKKRNNSCIQTVSPQALPQGGRFDFGKNPAGFDRYDAV